MFSSLLLFFRRFISRKKNVPCELYDEALRNENDGQFQEAKTTYERALSEISKTGLQDTHLKNKIIEKLKILSTVIDYGDGFRTGRLKN